MDKRDNSKHCANDEASQHITRESDSNCVIEFHKPEKSMKAEKCVKSRNPHKVDVI